MALFGPSRPIAVVLLLTCFGIGVYTTMFTSFQNGYFKFLEDAQLVPPVMIPGCPAPMKTEFTGIKPIDQFLTGISYFICTFIDGDVAWNWRVAGWYLMAQFAAGWALLSVEGLRFGNERKAAGWTGLMGVIFQHLSYTVTVPLYLILHLFSSPISQPKEPAASLISASIEDLSFLPIAMFFALFVPTFLLGLQAPEHVSVNNRYNIIAVWQFFPLWQSILQFLYRRMQGSGERLKPTQDQNVKALRRTYSLILGLAVAVQLPILAVTLTPASAVPAAWAPFFSEVTVSTVLIPRGINDRPSVAESIASGLSSPLAPLSGDYMQYDIYCGSLAVVVWALYLHRAAMPSVDVLALVASSAGWFLLGGPAAVATALLWERDEAVLSVSSAKKLR